MGIFPACWFFTAKLIPSVDALKTKGCPIFLDVPSFFFNAFSVKKIKKPEHQHYNHTLATRTLTVMSSVSSSVKRSHSEGKQLEWRMADKQLQCYFWQERK